MSVRLACRDVGAAEHDPCRVRLRHDQRQLLHKRIAIDHHQDLRAADRRAMRRQHRVGQSDPALHARRALANRVLDLLQQFGSKPRGGGFRFYRV